MFQKRTRALQQNTASTHSLLVCDACEVAISRADMAGRDKRPVRNLLFVKRKKEMNGVRETDADSFFDSETFRAHTNKTQQASIFELTHKNQFPAQNGVAREGQRGALPRRCTPCALFSGGGLSGDPQHHFFWNKAKLCFATPRTKEHRSLSLGAIATQTTNPETKPRAACCSTAHAEVWV